MSTLTRKRLFGLFRSPPLKNMPAPKTATVTATLTTAQILGQVLRVDQGSAGTTTLTTPTGTQIDAAIPGPLTVGDYFDLFVINEEGDDGGNMVLGMGTSVTLIGNNDVEEENAVENSSSAHFRFRRTAANTWDCMRLA